MITVNKLFNVISFEDIWSQLTSEFPEHFFYKTKNLYSQLFSYFANTEPDNSCGEKELQVLGYKETHQDYIVLCSFEDQFEYIEAVFLPWNIVSAAKISKETIQCYGAVELCKKIFVGLVESALYISFFNNLTALCFCCILTPNLVYCSIKTYCGQF